jgi:hypothetical protein
MAEHYMKSASVKRTAEVGTKRILSNLKGGVYKNASHEEAGRKMLAHYLNGGS